jgi:hypothetical protein
MLTANEMPTQQTDWIVTGYSSEDICRLARRAQRQDGLVYPPTSYQRAGNIRAIRLLLANLSGEQRAQYVERLHFDVTGGQSGRRYRLWHRVQQNIEELDRDGRRVCIWCFHPADVPLGSTLLAQKVALELFEHDAMQIARCYSDFAAPRIV